MKLSVKNFSCGYPGKFYLKNLNFEITAGSFTGIIGPNGCGKTTFLKGLSGEAHRRRGDIIFNNKSLFSLSKKERARLISVVPQEIEPLPVDVSDYVLMGRVPYHKKFQFFETRQDLSLVQKYMKTTGIEHLYKKNMDELSGGERQLAAVCKSLVQEPSVIFLDEPTSHLDISHKVEILNLLKRLNREMQLTIVLIIHDLNLASEFCDLLILMNRGEIYTSGTPLEVITYKTIEKVYNATVITKTNPLSGKPAVFPVSEEILKKNKKEKHIP